MVGARLKQLRLEKGLTQKELADVLQLSAKAISFYELNDREPSNDVLVKIAKFFKVSIDYLFGQSNSKKDPVEDEWHPVLTKRDERDIQKDLEAILNDMDEKSTVAMYNGGERMDEHTREMMRLSLESTLRMARLQAKEKFTPKKYRK